MSQLSLGVRAPEPQAVCVAWDACELAGFRVSPDLVSVVDQWGEDDRDFVTFGKPNVYPRMQAPEWPAFVAACIRAHAIELRREAVGVLRSSGYTLSTYRAQERADGRWTWEPSYRYSETTRSGVYRRYHDARRQKGRLYGQRRLAVSFGRLLARSINGWWMPGVRYGRHLTKPWRDII